MQPNFGCGAALYRWCRSLPPNGAAPFWGPAVSLGDRNGALCRDAKPDASLRLRHPKSGGGAVPRAASHATLGPTLRPCCRPSSGQPQSSRLGRLRPLISSRALVLLQASQRRLTTRSSPRPQGSRRVRQPPESAPKVLNPLGNTPSPPCCKVADASRSQRAAARGPASGRDGVRAASGPPLPRAGPSLRRSLAPGRAHALPARAPCAPAASIRDASQPMRPHRPRTSAAAGRAPATSLRHPAACQPPALAVERQR